MSYRDLAPDDGEPPVVATKKKIGRTLFLFQEGSEPRYVTKDALVENLYSYVENLLSDDVQFLMEGIRSHGEAKAMLRRTVLVQKLCTRAQPISPTNDGIFLHWVRSMFEDLFMKAQKADLFFGHDEEENHPLDCMLFTLCVAYEFISPMKAFHAASIFCAAWRCERLSWFVDTYTPRKIPPGVSLAR